MGLKIVTNVSGLKNFEEDVDFNLYAQKRGSKKENNSCIVRITSKSASLLRFIGTFCQIGLNLIPLSFKALRAEMDLICVSNKCNSAHEFG